jgi:hypothetical protein
MNANNAKPFQKFTGLFTGPYHPGIEVGYGWNWSEKKHHDWFQDIKLAYFYHRYVQHAIPLYTEGGYSYKVGKYLSAEATVGLGYLHSIPAVGIYKLNAEGEYKNHKGIGRPQANATAGIALSYNTNPGSPRPARIFICWQQRVQFPFVKSYVPLLPYNTILIGVKLFTKKI